MDFTCKQEECYHCLPDHITCFCNQCSCGKIHTCSNCVSQYCENSMYKMIKVYCNKCKKIVNCWYDSSE